MHNRIVKGHGDMRDNRGRKIERVALVCQNPELSDARKINQLTSELIVL